ncbi:secretory pathway protein-like protein Ssp120 [Aulographum hederae CBS 113979]|uniref:Secretory pathway protein-like protein Ssp120 n=1 Tax=Aulographum hederae CBS 113979 TaxID=1176131 RepID=A0A6G1HC75_9PEZI|nr:secretory pathway protein-like protein Ssp120 [Aulographum hederae CBS 113979]
MKLDTFSLLPVGAILLTLATLSSGHGDHMEQIPVSVDADWATKHMAEEHHINAFDDATFFTLHDYSTSHEWSPDDIKRTYGLFDPSAKDVPDAKRREVVDKVLELFDVDKSGTISQAEYIIKTGQGVKLPDFGLGPGHHGDDEYEYEIHHFEKFHSGDNVKEEDLNHPEDIEHFRQHEQMEEAQEQWEAKEAAGIVDENIPGKFRRE